MEPAPHPADLYEGRKDYNLKITDALLAEQMGKEMNVPAGVVAGYAGMRLMSDLRRKDPEKMSPTEEALIEVDDDLLGSEESKTVKVQGPKAFLDDLERYLTSMRRLRPKFNQMAFWRKALQDYRAYRKKTAEALKKKEMSDEGKADASDGEKKE